MAAPGRRRTAAICGRPGSHGGRLDHRQLDQQLPHAGADPAPLARGARSRGTRSRRPRAVVRADRAAPARSSRGQPPTSTTHCSRAAPRGSAGRHGAIRRNVLGCANLGYCGLGCPLGAKQSMDRTAIPDALATRRRARHPRARRTARPRRRPRRRRRGRRSRRARRPAHRPARVAACAVGGGRGGGPPESRAAAALEASRPARDGSASGPSCRPTTTRSRSCRSASSLSPARRSRSTWTTSPGATASPAARASTWRSRARSPS